MSNQLLFGVGGNTRTLRTGLVGYWRLSEASGNATDYSGNGNTLTDNNTVTSGTGKVEALARSFAAASNEYLSRADQASFEATSRSWTMCGWVRLTTTSNIRHIGGKFSTTDTRGYRIYFDNADDKLRAQCSDGTNNLTAVDGATIAGGTYYFVAAWFDAATQKMNLQRDMGTIAQSAAGSAVSLPDDSYEFRLGWIVSAISTNDMDGRLEQWGLWIGQVLSQSYLSYIYNGGAGRILF